MQSKTLKNMTKYLSDNKDFFLELGKVVGKGAGAVALLYAASKLNIPLTISPSGALSSISIPKEPSNPVFSNSELRIPNIIFSRNSQDSAINTFMELGKAASFDSVKTDYIDKIYKLVSGKCTDENTKMFAISAINEIANTMYFSSGKTTASNYILKIANR